MPPRKVWLEIAGTVYELTVYDVIAPVEAVDAIPFAQGPGLLTMRQVIYPVAGPNGRAAAGSGVALRPALAPTSSPTRG